MAFETESEHVGAKVAHFKKKIKNSIVILVGILANKLISLFKWSRYLFIKFVDYILTLVSSNNNAQWGGPLCSVQVNVFMKHLACF